MLEEVQEAKTPICYNCDEIIAGSSIKIDGRNYCNDCVYTCHSCDEIIGGNPVEIDGRNYCNDCVFTCHDCNNNTAENYGDGDLTLCESCRDENYFICNNCGDLQLNENYGSNDNCIDCSGDDKFYSDYVFAADFKPKPIFFGEEKLKFGVELEIDAIGTVDYFNFAEKLSKKGGDRIYLKKDGSLSEVGIEIVSHPMDIAEHKNFCWPEMMELAKKNGYKSHDTSNCGLHIHINKDYLSHSEEIRLGIFVAMNKGNIEKIARRTEERYAKFKQINGNYKDANKNNASRYEAINWNNKHTIEFRFFKGTLKYSTFLASIEFIHSLVGFIKQTSVTQIIKPNVFSLYVKHIQKQKRYEALEAYFKEREVK